MIVDRLKALVTSWPNNHGDLPDTDYQEGYMDASIEHARVLSELLADYQGGWVRYEPGKTVVDDDGFYQTIDRVGAFKVIWGWAIEHSKVDWILKIPPIPEVNG